MKTIAIAILSTLLTACAGSATMTGTDGSAGVVKLNGSYMRSMAEARLQMAEFCDGRFETVELDDAVAFRCAAAEDAQLALANR